MTRFVAGAALDLVKHKAVLIDRPTLEKIVGHIAGKDLYVALGNPRQTGKTTLLFQIRQTLRELGYWVSYVDLQAYEEYSKADFYQKLVGEMLDGFITKFSDAAGTAEAAKAVGDEDSFCQFLKLLASRSPGALKLVIMLDEIGGVPTKVGNTLFP